MPPEPLGLSDIVRRHEFLEDAKQLMNPQSKAERASQAHTDRGVLLSYVLKLTEMLEEENVEES